MIAVTVRSDFGAQEEEICHCFYLFPFYLPCSCGAGCHDLSFFFFWYLVLSWFVHSPSSSSSRGSLAPLCFLPLEWYHLHIWGCWRFSRLAWFQLVIIQPGISHDVLSIHVKQTGWQQTALSYFLLDLEPISSYKVSTIASWPAYRFLRRQVRWPGISI